MKLLVLFLLLLSACATPQTYKKGDLVLVDESECEFGQLYKICRITDDIKGK